MEANYIAVRFGELTTKGRNRKVFTKKLLSNTKEILKEFNNLQYDLRFDRLYITLNGEDEDQVCKKLQTVFGIHSFSIVYKTEKDLEEVKKVVTQLINETEGNTFKIDTKRSDKNYPKQSMEINREIAGHVFYHTTKKDLKVDVHNPDILIKVEIRTDAFYVYDHSFAGAGGYPVGVGGKALLMLSGGIDSPVAGYMMMKRGVDIECIHYASPPYTSELAREKMLDLCEVLRHYTHGKIRVHIIDFTELQLAVYDHCDESYAMTVMRRMMYRIGEKVAEKHNCLAIVNGESVGQVASQTLQSMQVINETIKIPVIRPVCCLDKLEIIDIAHKIGTYDISIRPHEDCCTIFTPKNPATKPRSYRAENYEKNWDFDTMVQKCVDTEEIVVVDGNSKEEDEDFF